MYNLALDCPDLNGQEYIAASSGQTFQISCETALVDGDITTFLAYTIQDCIESCGAVNRYALEYGYTDSSSNCTSIEFHALMGPPDTRTNCWLKWSNTRTGGQSSDSLESQHLAASAKLISS